MCCVEKQLAIYCKLVFSSLPVGIWYQQYVSPSLISISSSRGLNYGQSQCPGASNCQAASKCQAVHSKTSEGITVQADHSEPPDPLLYTMWGFPRPSPTGPHKPLRAYNLRAPGPLMYKIQGPLQTAHCLQCEGPNRFWCL